MFNVIITNHKTNRKSVIVCATLEQAKREQFIELMSNNNASVTIAKA